MLSIFILTFSFEITEAVHKRSAVSGLILSPCVIWPHPSLTVRAKTLLDEIWQLQSITQLGQVVRNVDISTNS